MPSSDKLAGSGGARPILALLGGFSLRIGTATVALPLHARRVLAYLSLDKISEPDCDRGVLAERLWADSSPDRSRASLRTALWRIRRASPDLVLVGIDRVRLGDRVDVDVHRYRCRAGHILSHQIDDFTDPTELLSRTAELLPGWDEVWLLLAREQLRQLRLHALEAAAVQMCEAGGFAAAIDVLLAVVAEEPLRESAQAKLIEAHISEGNLSEARRQFDSFATMLWNELGLLPSAELVGRVGADAFPSERGPHFR
ncbi:AfsR/SARP family transcriptional regulator [Rhodococcus tukisamuensis]|uniref:DNA-binding transcriptional activator of the SARP family n=1 Tax=Rhodococcus tukisamuensis TaxID=168276 RepID=A0A1G6RF76_9NOCA|nr:BTAD domain-containing putative transcriptional regulator [Rhodococcus tukisamuensis]SDD02546.1 DNA-binding transcriptional activator of the SARP family [Rhodococcus tukisamuensis]